MTDDIKQEIICEFECRSFEMTQSKEKKLKRVKTAYGMYRKPLSEQIFALWAF